MLSFLFELVAIETPSRDKESQHEALKWLSSHFKAMNFNCIHMPGRITGGYLYVRPDNRIKNAPIQLLIGHCDTVWQRNVIENMPITQANGQATGPGIYDMKAGITQIYFALKTISELGYSMPATPVILINSDEEIGSFESTPIIRQLSKKACRAYILEPPLGRDGRLKTARKGIGRFTIQVKGKAAHAGLDPGKGVNAIVELSHQIQKLHAMNDFERGITVNVGLIEGGYSANVVAAQSKAVIDVRVANIEDGKFITQKIFELEPQMKDVALKIDGGIGRMPMEPTARNQKLWRKAKTNGELIGLELKQATAGGGSDGNTTSLYTATLDGLGTVGDGAHANHEFILTDTIVDRAALLSLLLLEEV
ncbi:MAG: M20 family metallopeptidase [Bacteroidia bacterium]|nr:M20 family metallopeptidase [Bacteroidia bacterium]